MDNKQKRNSWLICLFLVVATVVVYLPVARFEFVSFDDITYLVQNPRIKQGFSWETIKWAFTSNYASNWHPLTWLSHVLDWKIYGSNAGGHHITNLLFHVANSLLLFVVLRKLTGTVWRSGIVAGFFALHPMHVESVAWVSERKDVLSTFFWLLTMFFYARYACEESGGSSERRLKPLWNYGAALVCFSIGLLAKQMLVTLPFVLLLLDFWPLKRAPVFDLGRIRKLALEKAPFFLITAILCWVALSAQKSGGAVASIERIPLDQRIENSLISYFRYFGKMIWPVDLTAYYPYPEIWPSSMFVGAAVFIVVGFAIAFWGLKTRPFIFFGWCWFVGTLIPVIGLVQIGGQSMADRYSYVPFIGLFIALVWSGHELLARRPILLKFAAAIVAVILLVHADLSARQALCWKDSQALYEHCLAVSENNTTMQANLGVTLLEKGMTNEAIDHFNAVLKIEPNDPIAHGNLADIYVARGNWEEAANQYQIALQEKPRNPVLHCSVGIALTKQDKWEEGIQHFRIALELNPDYVNAGLNLGRALLHQKKTDEAITILEKVVSLDPHDPNVLNLLGQVLLLRERFQESEMYLREAIRFRPDFADAHRNLGLALRLQPKNKESGPGLNEAVFHFKQAIQFNTNDVLAHIQMAEVATGRNETTNAISEYRECLRIDPDLPDILNNLAWILASSGDAKLRDGDEAVRLSEKACQLVGYRKPLFVGTLAAAYAEAGNFAKAVEMGEAAYQLANSLGQNEIAQNNLELLKLYRAGHPFWETPVDGTKK